MFDSRFSVNFMPAAMRKLGGVAPRRQKADYCNRVPRLPSAHFDSAYFTIYRLIFTGAGQSEQREGGTRLASAHLRSTS